MPASSSGGFGHMFVAFVKQVCVATSQQLAPVVGTGQLFAHSLSDLHEATHCFAAGGGAASDPDVDGGSFAVGSWVSCCVSGLAGASSLDAQATALRMAETERTMMVGVARRTTRRLCTVELVLGRAPPRPRGRTAGEDRLTSSLASDGRSCRETNISRSSACRRTVQDARREGHACAF